MEHAALTPAPRRKFIERRKYYCSNITVYIKKMYWHCKCRTALKKMQIWSENLSKPSNSYRITWASSIASRHKSLEIACIHNVYALIVSARWGHRYNYISDNRMQTHACTHGTNRKKSEGRQRKIHTTAMYVNTSNTHKHSYARKKTITLNQLNGKRCLMMMLQLLLLIDVVTFLSPFFFCVYRFKKADT